MPYPTVAAVIATGVRHANAAPLGAVACAWCATSAPGCPARAVHATQRVDDTPVCCTCHREYWVWSSDQEAMRSAYALLA